MEQPNNDSKNPTPTQVVDPTEEITPKEDQVPLVFDQNITYLNEKGLELPDLAVNSVISTEIFYTLLIEAYEALGSEIDITKLNPRNTASTALKKLVFLGAYDSYFMENEVSRDLDYGTAGYTLLRLQDSIQRRLYYDSDTTATIGDLLRRINVNTALHAWTPDDVELKVFQIEDLLESGMTPEQPLTRLMAARMLVEAYEDTCGELEIKEGAEYDDTKDPYALKAHNFFFWIESGHFEPEMTGSWEEWSFLSATIYDSQIRLGLKLEETKVAYGSVVASLTALLRSYENLEQKISVEKIIMNERPYDWFVYQQDTGEYGMVNCMPSCVEMSLRYQGITDYPTTEQLRKDNMQNGLGWTDGISEKVMKEYGLQFTDSFEINKDVMLDFLDQGNVLYVMYLEEESVEGHSVIIKGYWQRENEIDFIVADPNNNTTGPFGYKETIMNADTMLANMERHTPRYFIIPQGD